MREEIVFLKRCNEDVGREDGKVTVKKRTMSQKFSPGMKWKWRKRKYEKEGWQGWIKHFIFPFSQQNCWELVKYWLSGSDVSKRTTLLPLPPLAPRSPPCSVYLAPAQPKCAKQRKQSVTEHFSILLMLQLFLAWFDNINCCPQCYWWGDPSQSCSAQLRPQRIRPLAEPGPVGPALIQQAKA